MVDYINSSKRIQEDFLVQVFDYLKSKQQFLNIKGTEYLCVDLSFAILVRLASEKQKSELRFGQNSSLYESIESLPLIKHLKFYESKIKERISSETDLLQYYHLLFYFITIGNSEFLHLSLMEAATFYYSFVKSGILDEKFTKQIEHASATKISWIKNQECQILATIPSIQFLAKTLPIVFQRDISFYSDLWTAGCNQKTETHTLIHLAMYWKWLNECPFQINKKILIGAFEFMVKIILSKLNLDGKDILHFDHIRILVEIISYDKMFEKILIQILDFSLNYFLSLPKTKNDWTHSLFSVQSTNLSYLSHYFALDTSLFTKYIKLQNLYENGKEMIVEGPKQRIFEFQNTKSAFYIFVKEPESNSVESSLLESDLLESSVKEPESNSNGTAKKTKMN